MTVVYCQMKNCPHNTASARPIGEQRDAEEGICCKQDLELESNFAKYYDYFFAGCSIYKEELC